MSAETAWAAGLFEGEGCITSTPLGHITLTLTSTDRDVVERFAAIVGVGRVQEKALTPRPDFASQKPQYRWRVHQRAQVVQIMRDFWPWLGERRRYRFQEVSGWREATRQRTWGAPAGNQWAAKS